ncbi:hypothetical protein TELCIR_11244 [Teladorsagia circumcincta]|uniref:Choline/carnitine acyltransferase domain-containing protein n=1 Tax=Teladorsagia circumcincta TaxID=45464 RepID=A0A2G9U9Z3_TELCI|nr:hypothetical protein TELCIR_11244 [Teladorsagia circumcincta]
MQYERLFNSCRVPGEEVISVMCDKFFHWDDAKHVAVFNRGCWFKVIVHNGKRYLEACELQLQFDAILNQEIDPHPVEEKLAVLTAGERTHWAKTRRAYLRSGINRTSLNDIERAAFVVILDDEEVSYDKVSGSCQNFYVTIIMHIICKGFGILFLVN